MKLGTIRLGFVGFGHMGQILCASWERARLLPRSQILFHRRDPTKAKQNEQEFGITATSLKNLSESSEILLLCVRPNQMEGILKDLSNLHPKEKMYISVAAGVSIGFLQKYLGESAQIVRVMPNIASSAGAGMSLLSFSPHASKEFKSFATLLFGSVGQTAEIEERLMDIGCGMAGSGPAFVLELIEAMAKAGEEEGLPYSQALSIAAQTFLGAAELVRAGALPRELLLSIATPGGTTQAGLNLLRSEQVASRFTSAVRAASARSKQILTEYTP